MFYKLALLGIIYLRLLDTTFIEVHGIWGLFQAFFHPPTYLPTYLPVKFTNKNNFTAPKMLKKNCGKSTPKNAPDWILHIKKIVCNLFRESLLPFPASYSNQSVGSQ